MLREYGNVKLDPTVWGPHYWFFLHTIALTYPHYPNSVTKKKYYEFIKSLPLFIPVEKIASEFSQLLECFPVVPYLDNRDSFVRWIHFIHNKINEKLEKPKISLGEFYKTYYEAYKPKQVKTVEYLKLKRRLIHLGIVLLIVGVIYLVRGV
jgi:hypothetical protein